mmetsp:Transcript_14699/g.41607  ORF Transcript_14699/g.41607 Transcript_14699/m.41607 type:complete len:216 (-) Transcript_14699:721-1368(-)
MSPATWLHNLLGASASLLPDAAPLRNTGNVSTAFGCGVADAEADGVHWQMRLPASKAQSCSVRRSGAAVTSTRSCRERRDRRGNGSTWKVSAGMPETSSTRAGTGPFSAATPSARNPTRMDTPEMMTANDAPALALMPEFRSSSTSVSKSFGGSPLRPTPSVRQVTDNSNPAFLTKCMVRAKFRLSIPDISLCGGKKSPLSGPTSGDMAMIPFAS